MAIKFSEYQFEHDPEYDDYEFRPTEFFRNKVIRIVKYKICTKNNGQRYAKAVINVDNKLYKACLQGVIIVNTLANIESAGIDISNEPTKIVQTIQNGKSLNVFVDVEE